MVDPQRARRMLEALGDYRSELAKLRRLDRGDYLGQHAFAGRYLVQVSAQVAVDLANHVIASEGWRPPRELRDAFTVLEEQEVLPAELADRMRALTGLRNRLVHVYDEVDDSLVYAYLDQGLADLDRYGQAIATLIDRQVD